MVVIFVSFDIFDFRLRSKQPEIRHVLQRIDDHVSRLSLKAVSSSLLESVLVKPSLLSFVALEVLFHGMKTVLLGHCIQRGMSGLRIM